MTHDNISFKISVSRYYHHEVGVVLLFFGTMMIVSILTNLFLLLIILGILSTILLVTDVLVSMTKNQKRFDIITFTPTRIEISKETSIEISYIDIQKVVIYYSSTKGDQAKVRTMTGRDNTIKIITKEGEKIIKNIWSENEADYWRLKSLVFFLKERGVKVKMWRFWA